MKSLVILALLMLTSCMGTPDQTTSCTKHSVELKSEDGYDYRIRVYEYEYNNHKYQLHVLGNGNASVGGVVHDPECSCSK